MYSVCSSNNYITEVAMKNTLYNDEFLLIESTATQVNQFGGYPGIKTIDFKYRVKDFIENYNYATHHSIEENSIHYKIKIAKGYILT
nr:class II D-tagatose-bisphosphate aldolase, non-catalytic subunit [Clostridium sp.]